MICTFNDFASTAILSWVLGNVTALVIFGWVWLKRRAARKSIS